MKKFSVIFLVVLLIQQILSENDLVSDLKCSEVADTLLGQAVLLAYHVKKILIGVGYEGTNFYTVNRYYNSNVKIGKGDWDALQSNDTFKPSQRTVFIIHGYQTKYDANWINNLKTALIQVERVNIILVDWHKGSYFWNYVDSVRTTAKVTKDVVKFLKKMKRKVKSTDGTWRNLHFIGHSLGAHISGQIGHQLKNSSFNVERITGLDPAQPCFKNVTSNLKLDKNDAEFVDVIHTQTGFGDGISGLGLREAIGHADFYVNGGAMQPECVRSKTYSIGSIMKSYFLGDAEAEIDEVYRANCSHHLVNTYFTSSVTHSNDSGKKLYGYPWDGSYANAIAILDKRKRNETIKKSAEMGWFAKSNKRGTFIVFTAAKKPRYELQPNDFAKIRKDLQLLNPENQEDRKWLYDLVNAKPEDLDWE